MIRSRFLQSFRDAARGMRHTIKTEQNFRIQLVAAVVIVGLLWYFPLQTWERILVFLLCVAVLVMELLNTAFENIADLLKPRLNVYVSVVKDIMAAAVLLVSLAALVVGVIIFWPHFINIWKWGIISVL